MLRIEKHNKIIDLYLKENSIPEIHKITNISGITIKKVLIENKIELRKYSNKNLRKRNIDLTIFEQIDTHDKAYLLGLICSDGSISNCGRKFQISSKDKEMLENCKLILKSEHKLMERFGIDKRTGRGHMKYTVNFCSIKIVNDLKKLGISNNKSFNCPMPKIDDIYFWSFLRGLFDGDGSVYGKEGKLGASFICSYDIKNKIKEMFIKNGLRDTKVGEYESKKDKTLKIYKVKQGAYKDLLFLRTKMYENCNYKLTRKYERFLTLKEYVRGCFISHKNKVWKKVLAINNEKEIEFLNIKECATYFKVNVDSIRRVIVGHRNKCKGYSFKYLQ